MRSWFVEKRGYEYLLVFGLTSLVVLYGYQQNGIYPFGDTGILVYDVPVQYINFFGWFSEVLHGQAGLSYSLAKGLGGGMATTVAYYLSSPFSLLCYFFEPADAPKLFSWMFLLKISTCSLTCLVFLRCRFARHLTASPRRRATGLVFIALSIAYATSTYDLCYGTNIMWLDGVYMLPLVALGVWRLVARRGATTLFVATSCAIVFNWYTGYMLCLFSVFYYLFETLASHRRLLDRAALRYVATMLLAVGASMVLMLPNILGLLAGKGSGAGLSSVLDSNVFSLYPQYLLNYYCMGTLPGIVSSNNIPAIAASACVLLLFWVYFFIPVISSRERVIGLLVSLALVASLFIAPWSKVWSGFKDAPSYMERNSFVVLFFLLVLAARAWNALSEEGPGSWRRAYLAGTLTLAACFLGSCLWMFVVHGEWRPSEQGVRTEVKVLCLYAVITYLLASDIKAARIPAGAAIVALVACEAGYNATIVLGRCNSIYYSGGSVSSYDSYVTGMTRLYNDIAAGEGGNPSVRVGQTGFYYLGDKISSTDNASLLYGYSNFDHYSSTQEYDTQYLLQHLGYSKLSPFGTYYRSSNLVADDILSVSDIIATEEPASSETLENVEVPEEGYAVYSNTGRLPLAYGIADEASSVDWTESPFTNQELMLGSMAGTQTPSDLYVRQTPQEVSPAEEGARTWTIDVTSSGPLYVYTDSINTPSVDDGGISCKLYLDSKYRGELAGRMSRSIIYLGTHQQGERLTLTLVPESSDASTVVDGVEYDVGTTFDDASTDALLDVESLDTARLDSLKAALDTSGLSVDSYTDGAVDLSFQARSDETLLVAIPYDSGWTATVNGRSVAVSELYDGLMGIPVSQGANEVQLRYHVPGLAAGLALSLASIGAFALWQALRRRGASRQP